MKTEIIPVIHMLDKNQVLENINTCLECGVEKVFIINHAVSVPNLVECSVLVARKYPKLWVGINPLGVPAEDAVRMLEMNLYPEIKGVWCDETSKQANPIGNIIMGDDYNSAIKN